MVFFNVNYLSVQFFSYLIIERNEKTGGYPGWYGNRRTIRGFISLGDAAKMSKKFFVAYHTLP